MATENLPNLEYVIDYLGNFITAIWALIKATFWLVVRQFGFRDAGFVFTGIFLAGLFWIARGSYRESHGIQTERVRAFPVQVVYLLVAFVGGMAWAISLIMGVVAFGYWMAQPAKGG